MDRFHLCLDHENSVEVLDSCDARNKQEAKGKMTRWMQEGAYILTDEEAERHPSGIFV